VEQKTCKRKRGARRMRLRRISRVANFTVRYDGDGKDEEEEDKQDEDEHEHKEKGM